MGAAAAAFSLLLVSLFGGLTVNPVLSVEDLGADLDLLPVPVACVFSLVPPSFPVDPLGDLDLVVGAVVMLLFPLFASVDAGTDAGFS